jgi:hypothetical protein
MTPSKFSSYSFQHYDLLIFQCCDLLFIRRAQALKPFLHAGRWIPLAINPYANLVSVFFTALGQEADEDLNQSSEM